MKKIILKLTETEIRVVMLSLMGQYFNDDKGQAEWVNKDAENVYDYLCDRSITEENKNGN